MANYTIGENVTSKGIILKENDFMNVTSKGKASNTTVSSGGTMRIELGGSANITTVSAGGSMYIVPGGKASNTTVNNGGLYQAIGGSAISTTINSGGELQLMNGGYAYKTEVNSDGKFYVPGGNSAMTVTVHKGGLVYVANGGILFGTMKFDAGAIVSAHEGSIVDFNISIANLTDGVTKVVELSDLSIVQGAPTYTLTVDGYQAYGIYRLIGNAAGFDKTITVKNKQGEDVGTLTLEDNSLVLVDRKYILSINASSELVVTVSNVYDLYGRLEWTADLTTGMIASGVRVCSGGRLNVLNGGSASMTTIESNGLMYVSDGGFASKTSINDGIMHVSNGGSASMTTIYGIMHVSDGGKADGVTVGYGGKLNVSSGGTVNTTTIASQGSMYVSDGGKADDVTVGHRACLFVSSGGTATQILENGGYVNIDNGATVTFLPNSFGGYTYTFASATIHSGNTGTNLSANEWGKIYVIGGTVENTSVGSSGYLYVSSGGVANGATVNANGKLEICDGGKLTGKMSFEDNAVVSAYEGSIIDFDISGVSPNNDPLVNNLSLVQGAPACTLTVNGSEAAGDYKLAEGAAGFNKTIKVVNALGAELGTLTVDGGATTIGGKDYTLTLTDGGTLGVTVAGDVIADTTPPVVFNIKADITGPTNQNVTVTADFDDDVALASKQYRIGDGAWLDYPDGGVTVTRNGTVEFKATDTAGNETTGKYVVRNIAGSDPVYDLTGDLTTEYHLTYGKVASSVNILNGGELHVSNGAQASQTVMNSGGCMTVSQGGSADVTTVNSGGIFYVDNGCTATRITENGGYVWIHDNATVEFVPNSFGGYSYNNADDWATLHSGTTGTDLTVSNGGNVDVYYGGLASRTTLNSRGYLQVENGGSADVATVNSGGSMLVFADGTATKITENGGYVEVNTGATAEFAANEFTGLVLDQFATVHSGTTATDVTLNLGGLFVYEGGIANGVTVKSYGRLSVYDGGKVTGKVTFETGATAIAESGAILDFDLTKTTAGADALVNDLSFVKDLPLTYTLTVSGGEAAGNYKLAGNAAGFDKTIKVVNAFGTELGTLTVDGGTTAIGGRDYTLTLDGGVLGVTIGGAPAVVDLTGDLTGERKTISDGMFASGVNIKDKGYLIVEEGGIAIDTTVDFSARLFISSGGTAYNVTENGGHVDVMKGAVVTFASNTITGFEMKNGRNATVHSGTTMTEPVINYGFVYISSGGIANDMTVNFSGGVYIYEGGIAHNVKENGGHVHVKDGADVTFASNTISGLVLKEWTSTTVHSGTTVTDATVNANGTLDVYRGGKVTGKMTFETGATVTAEAGAIFDFDLTQTVPGAAPLVNDLSLVMDQPFTYTLTVDNSMDLGTYKLAGGATGFDKPITVRSIYGEIGCTLTVDGGATKLGDVYLTLALSGSDLTFTISENSGGGIIPDNKPDDGTNDYLYKKKAAPEWNNANIHVTNEITGNGEVRLDLPGTIATEDGWHNLFGHDKDNMDTGDVAQVEVNDPAKLTFTIDSNAAGTFFVYEDGFDKKGNRKMITVKKVTVKAGKLATLKDVCLTATGKYYVAMTAKNVKKVGTEGLYNVNVIESKFFVDADEGTNNTAKDYWQIGIGRGSESKLIILDGSSMKGSTEFKNFVGFTDGKDYAKLDLTDSAYLKFHVTGEGDGKAKFTVWKQDNATGKLSKVTSVSLPAKKVYDATTKAQFLDTSKYTYYVSMECSDEAKGKGLYYNVQVTDDTVFFDSADDGRNNVLYDKKAKAYYVEDAKHHFESTTIGTGTHVKLDSDPVADSDWENFVGYQDAADYAKINLTTAGNLTFMLESTGDATFAVYRKGQDKKGNETLETIQTAKLSVAGGSSKAERKMMISGLEAGEYYVSMTAKSTKANDKGSVFYNVTATLIPPVASALEMPMAAAEYADSVQDKLFGESGSGLLASL